MTFIGAVLGVMDKAHLGMDAVVRLLPNFGKRVCAVISHIVMLGTIVLLLVGSWKLVMLNTNVMAMGAIEYPLAWMYASGFVGSVGLLALVANNLRLLIQGKVRDEDLVMVQETEGLTDVERKAQEASQSGRDVIMFERKEGAA
jgi:TRAP-type C4-dicarboxylate transport system permease small subunit